MGLSKEFLQGLMDNQNFKKWFGESVVRDAEGLPLEVYHGSRASFDAIDPSLAGANAGRRPSAELGTFFSPVADDANSYAFSGPRVTGNPKVYTGYLSLQNPLVLDGESLLRMPNERVQEIKKILQSGGYDGVMDADGREVVATAAPQFKSRFNAGTFDPTDTNFLKSLGLMTAGAGAAAYGMSPDDAEASVPSAPARDLVENAGKDAEQESASPPREWAREAGNNTPNVAQALTPNDPFSPSPSQLTSAAALIAALKSKDQPLEDTYQPADLLTAFLTGGGGLAGRSIQAALDPVFSAAMDYAPRVADAINPRNIIMGLIR